MEKEIMNSAVSESYQGQIREAALDCFSRYGIRKTTIEDISCSANISRPTFYRFYANKNELLLDLALQEVKRIASHHLKLQKKYPQLDDVFTEAILHAITESSKSDVVNFLLKGDNQKLVFQLFESSNEMWDLQNFGWQKLIDRAKSENRLRLDLSSANISHWIALVESFLIIYTGAVNYSRRDLRKMIRLFIVPSILKDT